MHEFFVKLFRPVANASYNKQLTWKLENIFHSVVSVVVVVENHLVLFKSMHFRARFTFKF